MRARWLKPEFFTDKKIAALGPIAALVFEALWCMADDGGTVECDADTIKAQMFYRWSAVGVPEISEALTHLSTAGRIVRYTVGDDTYASIPTWGDHQKVHKPSDFRHPDISQGVALEVPHSPGTPPALLPASPPPRHLDSQTPRHPSTPAKNAGGQRAPADAAFETLWAIYPRRAGGNPKTPALKAYRARLAAGVTHDDIASGLARYVAYCTATGKVGTEYVKQAATFFGATEEAWKELWAAPAGAPGPRAHDAVPVTEAAAQAHEAATQLADRYQAEAHRAGARWARDHADAFEQIKVVVERPYAGKTGVWIANAIKAELTQRCAREAGFPAFDAWRAADQGNAA